MPQDCQCKSKCEWNCHMQVVDKSIPICHIPEDGLVIDHPGIWVLKCNIDWEPTEENKAAITICSSNVTLNFRGYRLRQKNGTTLKFTTGVLVKRHVNTVAIYGDEGGSGSIYGFSQFGIRTLGDTHNILIRDLTVTECGKAGTEPRRGIDQNLCTTNVPTQNGLGVFVGGIVMGESMNFGLGPDSTQNNSPMTRNLTLRRINAIFNYSYGLAVFSAEGVEVDDSHFDRQTRNDPNPSDESEDNLCGGFIFGLGQVDPLIKDVTLRNCTGDGNRNFTKVSAAYSYNVLCYVTNFRAFSCSFSNNVSDWGNVHGVDTDGVWGTLFEDCSFNDLTAWTDCHGLHYSGSFDGFNQCAANYADNRHITVRRCEMKNIQVIGDDLVSDFFTSQGRAAGFWGWGDGVLLEDVWVNKVEGVSVGVGIYLSTYIASLRDVTVRRCTVGRVVNKTYVCPGLRNSAAAYGIQVEEAPGDLGSRKQFAGTETNGGVYIGDCVVSSVIARPLNLVVGIFINSNPFYDADPAIRKLRYHVTNCTVQKVYHEGPTGVPDSCDGPFPPSPFDKNFFAGIAISNRLSALVQNNAVNTVQGHGIMVDKFSQDCLIQNNTIIGCTECPILDQNAVAANAYQNNILFNNGTGVTDTVARSLPACP